MQSNHSFPVTVYYEDTDMGGVVYYANYLRYIERARSDILAQRGVDQNALKAAGIVFVVTRIEANYRGPARLGDALLVRTGFGVKSPVRWIFCQEVIKDGRVIFDAQVSVATMNEAGRPARLPEDVQACLSGK